MPMVPTRSRRHIEMRKDWPVNGDPNERASWIVNSGATRLRAPKCLKRLGSHRSLRVGRPVVQTRRGRSAASYGRLSFGAFVPV